MSRRASSDQGNLNLWYNSNLVFAQVEQFFRMVVFNYLFANLSLGPGPSDRFLGKNLVVTGKMINFAAVISNSKKL